MTPTDAIPLLIVVLLMVSIGGGDVQQMTVTFQGDNNVEALEDVHVVAGGTLTVPENASVSGDVYAIGGTTTIAGELDGDVTVLAGNLSIVDSAAVTGSVQSIAGESAIAPGVRVGDATTFEPPAPASSPWRRVGGLFVQFLVLAAAGWWLVSRHPGLLDTVSEAITDHALVSGVVGSLAATSLLVLFVYMAFTILLLPLSIVGLFAELLVVLYGQLAFGYLIGTRLPIEQTTRATVVGIAVFLLIIEGLGLIPYIGALVQLGLIVVGFGAVLNTYFGLQRFEPVTIPGGVE
ncbi:hypothetical protein Huta_0114 [Halorhabdus utahensis DSM 12940]|uniref:DUF8173 domain-containing protein n=1 Tax=Halorhabdus utahensis (strain DSM 12940 / JCM 11049 / AX-2) TaxID=519442 RepID=C7NP12_HALUD|nr:polymer-forming cytoskeletal protein [Halorhabdus utahensis]ACV10303.1 hypothetical protein Huta_0114 [Halorhabdus utahensis DSM 12940]